MNKQFLYLGIISIAIWSCSGNKTEENTENIGETKKDSLTVESQIIGEWVTTSEKITLNTVRNSDSTSNVDINESNWEKVLNTKPTHLLFKEDKTFQYDYRDLKDASVGGPSGTWYFIGDTIVMNEKFPNNYSYALKVNITGGQSEFSGKRDQDADGKIDDDYLGTWKRK